LKNYNLVKTVLIFLIFTQSIYFAQTFNSHTKSDYLAITGKFISKSLTGLTGYKMLKELTKKIGPRLSGSPSASRAVKWAKEKLKRIGADSLWYQKMLVPHWVRGDSEKAILVSDKMDLGKQLNIASLGSSIGTDNDGLFEKVLEVHSFDELDSLKDLVDGKIVFFNTPFDQTLVNTFNAYSKAVQYRVYGASRAAKYGAAAVLVRSVTSLYDNVPHVGVMVYKDSVEKIPAAAISLEDADFLSDVLKIDPGAKIYLNLNCANLPEIPSYNVIGEIKGSEKPDEIILIGAHLDSWDKGEGAHDDGAGVVQALEVLYLFKNLGIHPKRTVRCVLYMNEENGSRGAKKYGEYADTSKERHIAAIESDRGGFTPRGFSVKTDSVSLAKMQSWLPVLQKSLIDWIRPGGTGADISKIKNAKALIGFVPDSQRYFELHHSAHDVLEAVNPRELELGTAAIATLTYLLSEEGL